MVAVLMGAAGVAFAQVITCGGVGEPPCSQLGFIFDPSTAGSAATSLDIPTLVINLVNWFAWFVSLAAVVMGLYAGFLFITARGEAAQLSTARKTLTYAIIGIAVAVFSFSIIIVTKAFFGL